MDATSNKSSLLRREDRKTTQFRRLLDSPSVEFICEAHNGLSAKIVEQAGFQGIWASGLTMSAQLGVRDNNEASWTQVLDVLEFMSDAAAIPIMLDGDTGYGNFNSVQRLVRKLEQRSVAAVCIEDKVFPKTNSFIDGHRQTLADIDEFCGKIKAGKDAQKDDDFSIVARVEAFIAGWGLGEALKRAEAYHRAGADGILIHSALVVPDEILAFKREWGDRSPVVIVPTKYYSTPTDVYEEFGFSLIIWANHLLRGAMSAMKKIAASIYEDRGIVRVEDQIATVADIFAIQDAAGLSDAERQYLPSTAPAPTAIVLAAGQGEELGDLTEARPKTMIEVNGKPLLSHIIESYNSVGIRNVIVVRGFAREAVDVPGAVYVDNEEHDSSGELVSLRKGLACARTAAGGVVVSYGDVLFRKYIVELLNDVDDDVAIVVDTEWRESANLNRVADYVNCSTAYSRHNYDRPVFVEKIDSGLASDEIHGEWMGFLRIAPSMIPTATAVLDELLADAKNRNASVPVLIQALVARGIKVRAIFTSGNWCDVDSLTDVYSAGAFT